MTDLRVAEKLAWLLKSTKSDDVAFLECEGKVYFARHSAGKREPTSAIVALVQGLHEHPPESVLKLVRQRIYATAAPTNMCRGLVKVTARRLTAPITPIDHRNIDMTPHLVEVTPPNPPEPPALVQARSPLREPAQFMKMAFDLATQVPRDKPLYECSRPIAAILVSATNEILAHALNTNVCNRTQHAEVNLIQSYYLATGRGVPANSTLYTTLKPCRMCAAMIWHMADDIKSLQVFYGAHDPGPQARETILDARSPDRRHACLSSDLAHLLDLQLEQLLL